MAASPAPGSPLDSSDMLVVSDSSTATLGNFCMARDAAGDFVMVWGQQGTSFPNPDSIHVQRFDAAGMPQGSAFQVETSDDQPGIPSVAMDAAGDFVVAWQSVGAPYQQTATYDVHAQRYSAAGVAQGSELLVSTFANFDDLDPSVAMDAAGDFVIVWQGEPSPGGVPEPNDAYRIYARRYSAAGVAQGDQSLVTDASTTIETGPNVAMDAAGDFVVAWQTGDHKNMGYHNWDILAQRFDAAGAPRGGAFPLSTAVNTGRAAPRVTMDAGGSYVVAWINYDAAVQATTGDVQGDIHAQRYDAAGTAQGSELAVNSFTVGDQSQPSITMDAAGDFAVAWDSYDQAAPDSNYDVYAQRFSAAGTPVGAEFLVNTLTQDSQTVRAATMDADGDMVVAWSSFRSTAPHSNIYVRRFAGEESVDLGLEAAFAPATPSPGSDFSMTLAVNNISATTPTGVSSVDEALDLAVGITGSVTLPAGATYRSVQGTDWTCTGPVNSALSCSYGGALPAGAAAPPLTVMLTAPSRSGTLAYSAKVESDLKPDAPSTRNSTSGSVRMAGVAGSAGGSGGDPSSGTAAKADPPATASGGGALDLLGLAWLGLALLGRRRARA